MKRTLVALVTALTLAVGCSAANQETVSPPVDNTPVPT